MNKGQAGKLVGQMVRLQPVARHSGRPVDDDWFIIGVADQSVTIRHTETESIAVVGLDGIYSYFTDPSRTTSTQKCGTLQLLVQVDIAADGLVSVTPLPPPRAAVASGAVRPRLLVQYDIPFLWDKEPVRLGEEQSFVVTNSGPPARNVVIGPINIDERHRAVFDEISAVHEGQPVSVTPRIEQDDRLYGGIFERNLKVTLQGFVNQRGKEGANHVVLPFAATYRDFDGRTYTTTFELQVSGPMMSRVKVEKVGDVGS